MKKFIISLILLICLTSPTLADNPNAMLLQGVKNYKNNNYLGTIQIMEKVIEKNPGSIIAHYYMAISYVQIGKANEAETEYNKVIALNPYSQFASYAELGKERLHPEEKKKQFSKEGLFKKHLNNTYSDNVEKKIKQQNIDFIKEKVNNNEKINPSEYKKFEDFTPKKSSNAKPSSKEIADAYETLSRAGINPSSSSTQGINPQMMEMNMLTSSLGGMGGGRTGGNSMKMLPLLMMMQNQQQGGKNNVDPQFMQTMLSNMMMPDITGLYGNNKNY